MTDQPSLFKPPKPVAVLRPLTARQERIYALVCSVPGGIEAPELGALIHAGRARHTADDRCIDCGRDGQRALKERAIRQRVIRRPGARYEPRSAADRAGEASAQLRELPDDLFGAAA